MALQAAQSKAEVLLGTIFERRPPAINLQEQTVGHYPPFPLPLVQQYLRRIGDAQLPPGHMVKTEAERCVQEPELEFASHADAWRLVEKTHWTVVTRKRLPTPPASPMQGSLV